MVRASRRPAFKFLLHSRTTEPGGSWHAGLVGFNWLQLPYVFPSGRANYGLKARQAIALTTGVSPLPAAKQGNRARRNLARRSSGIRTTASPQEPESVSLGLAWSTGPVEIAPLGRRHPFKSFMKTKLKVTASQVRKTVRKPIPRPCRAFSSTPSRLQFA